MTSRLDHTIVIPPSSPEQNWARSVSPCTPTRLFGLSPLSPSPPSLPSPSKLFEEFGLGPQNNPPSPKSPLARTVEKTAALRATAEKPLQNESSSKTGRPGSSKAKTVRNRKGSKSQETQNKIITGRVAKATAVSKTKDTSVSKAKAGVKKSKTGSQNENIKPTKEAEAEAKKVADSEGLNLEEALKRRLDWTPPRVSDLISVDVHSPSQSSGTKLSFGAALSNYHYDRENSLSESAHPSKEGNPTKRRRLELVEFEVLQERKPIQQKQTRGGETRKTKPKPKKQPKTITARVTARYEQIGDPEDLFVYEEKSSCEASVDFKKPTKPKKKTAAKQKEPEYIILSPDAATKSINDQNFLFGTCSQLERDDSPTFFNETQRATRLSESLAFEKTDSVMVTTASSTTSITNRFTGTKSHWSEAARDLNGALVQPEVIDMTDSPTVSTALSRLSELNPDAPKVASLVPSEDDFATDPLVDKGVITSSKPAADIQFTPLNSISDKAGPTTEPSTRKATSQLPEMPNFNGYTDSELSKQVLSYGFKAVRGRKKMIDLLEKCWQSKHGSAATSAASVETSSLVTINETVSVSTAKSSNTQVSGKMPVRKKKTKPLEGEPKTAGRAGKKASKKPAVGKADKSLEKAASPVRASTYMVDEIEDSEEEIIPSPTRIRMQHQSSSRQTTPAISCLALGNKSKQPSISTKTSAYDDSTLLELQNGITKAVHLQTRPRRSSDGSSHSPQLTWHEKILLYEPIILEDFAAWLNTEGFVSIYEDREVGVALVRTWCESQGICCTFRA